ncbi:MAG: M60 family metallopeptidase, partial [Rikenellaceae bacterium]
MKKLTIFICALFSSAMVMAQNLDADLKSDSRFFTDPTCSALKQDVKSVKKIKSPILKEIAREMLSNNYASDYLVAEYEAYPSPSVIGRVLKLGDGFSKYENITGVYLEKGEHVVLVGNTHGKTISLLLPNFMRKPAEGVKPTEDPLGWGLLKQEIKLKEGVNVINVEKSSNAYISYFDDDYENAPKIKVHFPTGKVNGYFDSSKNNDADWDNLLKNAVSPIMDARGKYIQVAYPVQWFKEYTSGKGAELMASYDAMLESHYTLMGLVKYNKIPKNRILARVNFNYYMFRDEDGVAYLGDARTMRMVADPKVVISGDPCWGFSHEVGHVMQIRPQMTWGGMTEVSNNLFSLYTLGNMGNESRLKNQNNYNLARNTIIGKNISYLQEKDVFNRLVPFWQLHLYFTKNGFPDFYADIMEKMRLTPDAGRGNKA